MKLKLNNTSNQHLQSLFNVSKNNLINPIPKNYTNDNNILRHFLPKLKDNKEYDIEYQETLRGYI